VLTLVGRKWILLLVGIALFRFCGDCGFFLVVRRQGENVGDLEIGEEGGVEEIHGAQETLISPQTDETCFCVFCVFCVVVVVVVVVLSSSLRQTKHRNLKRAKFTPEKQTPFS
jgi:hypothetical protein